MAGSAPTARSPVPAEAAAGGPIGYAGRSRSDPPGADANLAPSHGAALYVLPERRGGVLTGTRSHRLRTLAEIPVEVELGGPPTTPVYQSIAAEAARMCDAGLTFQAVAERFGVDDHTAAKAVRWFRQR